MLLYHIKKLSKKGAEELSAEEKKVVIFGYYGAGNAGDEIILKNLLKILPPKIKPIVISRNPKQTEKDYHVKAIKFNTSRMPLIFFEIIKSDAVVIGGGDLLQELTSRRSLVAVYLIYLTAKFLKKKIIFFGVSVGPVFSKFGKKFIEQIAEKSDLIVVRDNFSKNFLEELSSDSSKIIESVDIAFLENFENSQKFPMIIRDFPEQKIIGVSLRDWFGGQKAKKIKILACFFDYLTTQLKFKIVFLPFQFSKDKIIENIVFKKIQNKDKVFFFSKPLGPDELKQVIISCDLIFGMRLHSLILGALALKPIFSLSYSFKNKELMKQFGLLDYDLSIEQISFEKLKEVFQVFYDKQTEIIQKIQLKLPDLKNNILRVKEFLYNEL